MNADDDLTRQLREAFGSERVGIVTVDELGAALADITHKTVIMQLDLDCANSADMGRKVDAAIRAIGARRERKIIELWLPGFDDDPRELDQIPEARASIAAFAKQLDRPANRCLSPAFYALALLCLGLAERGADGVTVEVVGP